MCQYASDAVIVMCADEGEVTASIASGAGITTGGGFSEDFEAPWYQKGPRSVVREYLKQTDSPLPDASQWFYDASGRAYPDISGTSNNYLVWMGDHFEATSGTSASTPLLAAKIARLNDDSMQRGLPPMGIITPLLYRLGALRPEAFNDVVTGSNRCGVERCGVTGFGAARIGGRASTSLASGRTRS